MYRQLGAGKLSTGENLIIGVVEAPDAAWAERVGRFLVHKGGDWTYHVEQALHGPLDDLQTRFYVGTVGDELVSQVMITGRPPAGILGHVFTAPAWRQRGAYRQVMAAQMADVRALGFEILTLGTGYASHPYAIYHSFGFRPVAPESGKMRWLADPEAEARFLAPGPAQVRTLGWGDWGALNVVALRPLGEREPLPRLPALGIKGQENAEGPFLTFMCRNRQRPGVTLRALASATGAVVGWCLLTPDRRWFGDAWLFDAATLPAFSSSWPALTADLAWPDAPVYSITTPDQERAARLTALGFSLQTTLPAWLNRAGAREDVQLWVRGGA